MSCNTITKLLQLKVADEVRKSLLFFFREQVVMVVACLGFESQVYHFCAPVLHELYKLNHLILAYCSSLFVIGR